MPCVVRNSATCCQCRRSAILGIEPQVKQVESQPGDVRRTFADIGKARQVLGYDPTIAFEEGIADFVRWYGATYGS